MIMKRILASLLIIVLLSSCMTVDSIPYSGAGITSALERKDYKVLGDVKVKGTVTNILGMFTFGGKGYEDLLAEAKEIYPECDAVINVYQDRGGKIILGIYNTLSFTLIGTAIDIIDSTEVTAP